MQHIPSTSELRTVADAVAERCRQLRDDLARLEGLVELTGIELAEATRHSIGLELHDLSLALHAVALSVRAQRRSPPVQAGGTPS